MDGNYNMRDPLLYFKDLWNFPYQLMKTNKKVKKNTFKFEMVLTCANHDRLVQIELMQVMEGN